MVQMGGCLSSVYIADQISGRLNLLKCVVLEAKCFSHTTTAKVSDRHQQRLPTFPGKHTKVQLLISNFIWYYGILQEGWMPTFKLKDRSFNGFVLSCIYLTNCQNFFKYTSHLMNTSWHNSAAESFQMSGKLLFWMFRCSMFITIMRSFGIALDKLPNPNGMQSSVLTELQLECQNGVLMLLLFRRWLFLFLDKISSVRNGLQKR